MRMGRQCPQEVGGIARACPQAARSCWWPGRRFQVGRSRRRFVNRSPAPGRGDVSSAAALASRVRKRRARLFHQRNQKSRISFGSRVTDRRRERSGVQTAVERSREEAGFAGIWPHALMWIQLRIGNSPLPVQDRPSRGARSLTPRGPSSIDPRPARTPRPAKDRDRRQP